MPGFDGTGPRGAGPMTGGARGYCTVPMDVPRTELDSLKSQMSALKAQLEQIEDGIEQIKSKE